MNSHKVIRTFHPVGQGAFYSERHDNFNIVYDCGAMPLSNDVKSVVKNAFSADEDIDVLFISHFDYDHVSAIATLMKSVRSIKRVVLPLLDKSHAVLLTNINRALSHNILKLINDPESFFGRQTMVIYVRPSEGMENEENRGEHRDLREFESDKKENRIINSGTALSFGGTFSWFFIPYNYLNHNRSTALISELKKGSFDVDKLQNEPGYTLHEITNPQSRKAIRSIYASLDGNVNENSMLLYSGPANTQAVEYQHYCDCGDCEVLDNCWPYCLWRKLGCIYTGDCDFNKIQLDSIYPQFIKNVGVVQIPHHGSSHSFSINSLREYWHPLLCPVSFGTKNNYGHPAAEVVNKLALAGHNAILVNEQPNSTFEQELRIYSKKAPTLKNKIGIF